MSLGVIVPIDVHNFKEHQLQQLKVDFGNFDKNGNGRLDKKEFVQWLVHNGSTEKNAKHAFEIADVNKDGTLSLNEFLDYARKLDDVQLNGDLDEYIRMVFKAADKKKEGELDMKGFKKFMKLMNTPVGLFSAKKIFSKYDEDTSGMITFDEMLKRIQVKYSQALK